MLHVVEVNDVRFAVFHGCQVYFVFFCHILTKSPLMGEFE